MAQLTEIVFDCEHAPTVARFWAAVLDGYDVLAYDDAELNRLAALGLTPDTDPTVAVVGPGPRLFFQQVDEPRISKNRVHLDVTSDDRPKEVERLVSLGATIQAERSEWTSMLDPEGNEFCVADL